MSQPDPQNATKQGPDNQTAEIDLFQVELDSILFETELTESVNKSVLHPSTLDDTLAPLTYKQLDHLREQLIQAAAAYLHDVRKIDTNEKKLSRELEDLLEFKVRTDCEVDIEICAQGGCSAVNQKCAIRKAQEDIVHIAKLLDKRKRRSSEPHIALELFFNKLIHDFNCIGVILADKLGAPKIFATDGSGISRTITVGTHRLQDAILDHEFRFSKHGGPYMAFHQRFSIEEMENIKIKVFHKNPDLRRYLKNITYTSVGFDVAYERIILSIIHLGDNQLEDILPRALLGIRRIRVETDPEAKFRVEYEGTILNPKPDQASN